ncbi:MAG: NADH:ubiquinone oxidoreductase subunit 1, partial [Actinobacteria bacterium]|nr:NADH:ubiquinone oxidoreductase subunit 1 [Actinomycetota bacterium]
MVTTLHHILANSIVLLALKLGILLLLLPATLVVGYVELKVMAHMQHRLGPMYAGAYHGWAQTLADGLKFIQKEDIMAAATDRTVFSMVPYITMLGAALTFVVIPFSRHGVIANLDIGLFYALAVSSISVIGVL